MTTLDMFATQDVPRALPKGWRWVRLGELISETRNGLYKPDHFYGSGVPILKMFNIGRSNGRWNLERVDRIELTDIEHEAYRFEIGDIMVNRVNSRELVGKCAVVDDTVAGMVFESKNMRVRLDTAIAYPDYVASWLNSSQGREQIEGKLKQIVGQATVNRSDLDSIEIPLAPLAEQRRIAAILAEQLAAVERARAAAAERLEAARALPAAYLRAVFESEEARGWPTMPLGEAGSIGAGITLGRSFNGIPTRRVAYLRVANVKDGYLDLSDVYEIDVPESDIDKCRLKYGDLLLTEGGDPDKLGRGTFWEGQIAECIHQNHIFRVRFDLERYSPPFLAAQLGSSYGKAYFLSYAKQTTGIATINQRVLGGFPLMVPPLPTQERVVRVLSEQMAAADRARAALQAQLDAIDKLPAALLRRAFSGEV